MTTQMTTLANGLRVISESRQGVETTAVGVWVDAGARYETNLNNGVAHMLEHMAFKGTQSRSAQDIAVEIESVGGHLNAYTSREHTAYFARVLKEDLPLSIEILADILQHSTFEEEELVRERAVVIQEIGQAADTPDDIIFDHLQAVCFPDQPLGRSILGPVDGVANMDREVLFDFKAEHYTASRMLLCAAVAVEHDALVALAKENFSALRQGGLNPFEAAVFKGGERRDDRELEQVHFALALPALAYEDDDFYPMQVMSTVLGGGMSSRLFQEIREKRGLCYSIFCFASSYKECGSFTIYAGTGADQTGELVPVICEELLRLGEDASSDEVDRARSQLKAGTLMSLESSASRAEQLARQTLVFGRQLPLAELIERIDAVDAAAVRRVASRITGLAKNSPDFALAAMGPIRDLVSYDKIAAKLTGG